MRANVQRIAGKLSRLLPKKAFFFDTPLLLLQSDDWGRVGIRDQEGFEQLRETGIPLGERPYDFYSFETADDLAGLRQVLLRHRDPTGRPPVCVMNFITANLDFHSMAEDGFKSVQLRALADGLPGGWSRPGLLEAYREGIASGVFYPALHGTTHFCRQAVDRHASADTERGALLRKLWSAGTPYIHWRMPWIGYEYWDPEQVPDFLKLDAQMAVIGAAVGLFIRMFSKVPYSACAPGYRANADSSKAWSNYGIRCAQNGPGALTPPHYDGFSVLQLYRNVEIEPAVATGFSLEAALRRAEECFAAGIPAIVSMHSINFHSSVRDYRSRSLTLLDEFLTALERRYPKMLYVHDEDLCHLVDAGTYDGLPSRLKPQVSNRRWWANRSQIGILE